MRKKKQIPISSFLKQELNINRKSINLQNKGITVIDEVSPFLSSQIQSLNLKNNKLVSLKGISQFGFLRELDISYNMIGSCSELSALRQMVGLKKLYFSNNPFLNEPLQEDLLQIIFKKQTDLQVLSLELMKEVQNEQIKIIFLKNYLSKIELHEELKQKEYVEETNSKLKTQKLIDKIIPQFYSIIQNQKITNSIKKQAMDIKKQTKGSFQGALSKSKNIKEKKIDQLIGNIVQILHQTNTFTDRRNFMLQVNLNNSTISFSPQRNRTFTNTVEIEDAQFSPVRYIEFSKDDNTFQDITLTNPNKQISSMNKSIGSAAGKKVIQPSQNLDHIDTSRKNNESLSKSAMKINNVLNQSKQIEQRQMSRKVQVSQNRNKFQRTLPKKQQNIQFTISKGINQRSEQNKKKQYIKLVQIKGEQIQQPEINYNKQTLIREPYVENQSIISWKNIIQYPDQLSPEKIEIIYFKTLPKMNPMFNLLLSPAKSLKDQEKETVLEALKLSHKQYFIDLLKQKVSSQALMRQIDHLKNQSTVQLEQIFQTSKNTYHQNNRLKEEFHWIDSRYKVLQQDYAKLHAKNKELQISDKNKSTVITTIEASYQKIKQSYLQKTQEIQRLQSYNQKEEQLAQKFQLKLKQIYFNLIKEKARIWTKVLAFQQKSIKKKQKSLYLWGLNSFKENRQFGISFKKRIKMHTKLIVKQHFLNWAILTVLEKKQKCLTQRKRTKVINQFLLLLNKNSASSKMKKLREIWAVRFYKSRRHKNGFLLWKTLNKQRKNSMVKAIDYCNQGTTNTYFKAIIQLMNWRKNKTQQIGINHEGKVLKRQLRKLIYLINKQIIQNSQKEKETRLFYERCTRKHSYNLIKANAKYLMSKRLKINQLNLYCRSKVIQFWKKQYRFFTKRMQKLSSYIHYCNWKIVKNYMLREKKSIDYNNKLVSKNKRTFVLNMRHNKNKQKSMKQSLQKISVIRSQKLLVLKLKFIKWIEVARLKGRNFVKNRVIQQMDVQMNLNDNQAIQIIKQGQVTVQRCQQQINFLKKKIQMQSHRQILLLTERDQLAISINESYQMMVQLRKQIDLIRGQTKRKDDNYNNLVRKYNEAVTLLQRNKQTL